MIEDLVTLISVGLGFISVSWDSQDRRLKPRSTTEHDRNSPVIKPVSQNRVSTADSTEAAHPDEVPISNATPMESACRLD